MNFSNMYLYHVCLFLLGFLTLCNVSFGRCPTASAFGFVQNASMAQTATISGSYYLPTDTTDSSSVLPGAFIPMACNNGYINIGGPLNITCVGAAWTTFPNCISTVQTTTLPSISRCPYGTLQNFIFTATGIQTTSQSQLMQVPPDTSTVLSGSYIVMSCLGGYTNMGGSLNITCYANGSWSQFPNCVSTMQTTPLPSTSRCLYATLQNFIYTATGIQTTGQAQLTQIPPDTTTVISGSYIVVNCLPGYTNIGGSLNITCYANGSWSQLPNCVSTMQTTMLPSTSRCLYATLQNFIYTATGIQTTGQAQLTQIPPDTTTVISGSYIVVNCLPGYTNIGGSLNITCYANGSWSQLPNCVSTMQTTMLPSTSRCLYATLQNFIYTATGIQTTSQAQLTQIPPDTTTVISGSYIVMNCLPGYTNMGGSLNITCYANGSWSQLPNCVPTMQTTPLPSTSRCLYATLQNFIYTATGIQTTSQAQLTQIPPDTSTVISGSYIVMNCLPGYTNMGGSLNITCYANGSWSQLPNCFSNMQTTMLPSTSRCLYGTLQNFIFTATGIQTTSQAQLTQIPPDTTTVISGSYIVMNCLPGYTNMGGSLNITCYTNGSWSQLPNCVSNMQTTMLPSTSRCLYATLQNFIYTATGIQTTSQAQLTQIPPDTTTVISGSYIVMNCLPGYTNMGGSLNITCYANGSWSQLPNCVPTMQTTTTTPSPSSSICAIVPSVPNSYVSSDTYVTYPTLRRVEFTCNPGYMHVNTSGRRLVNCNNGVWDLLPACALIPTCSIAELQAGFSSMTKATIVSKSMSVGNGGILARGWISLQCLSNSVYNPLSGPLNITCLSTGKWTQFPSCV